jgi:hypothetical protein
MLELAVSQKRWNRVDVVYEMETPEASLYTHLRNLLSDRKKLWQSVEQLVSLSAINLDKSDGIETYIRGPESVHFPAVQNR